MIDGCGRTIDHLRLSLTDHCNLACRYCVSEDHKPSMQMIDAGFAYEAVRWLSQRHGIRHVRLTGGEPLLYPDLLPLTERLAKLDTLHEITLTTNSQALVKKARALRDAGLSRINISLDTLDPEQFAHQTRGGDLARTLAGIEEARRVDLTPIKINVVAQRSVNDEELADLAFWGLSRGCIVRFLEVMPIGPLSHVARRHLISEAEILTRLAERFTLRPIPQSVGQPATDYAATGSGVQGVIGVIAPTTRPFCSRCRRLRVTSRGHLVACLHDRNKIELISAWDGARLDEEAANVLLHRAIAAKPEVSPQNQSVPMIALGG